MAAKPCVLITRPEPQASQLASKLQLAGYATVCQPLFYYQAKDTLADLTPLLTKNKHSIVIFVSKAAVDYAHQVLPVTQWQVSTYIAVGHTTQKALADLGVENVITPTQHDSEGILSLAQLQQVSQRNIIIVRGDGGRELIAEQLVSRGANVQYFESYQRRWHTFTNSIIEQWQAKQVNTIWITSNAILESVVQLINDSDNFWQNTCLWLVASTRIAERAKHLGIKHVICTNSAMDNALLQALSNLE